MRHFPAFLALKGRRVVVVGKTPQADQRASLAQRAGASVERVANLDDPNLLHGATLLFVATGSLELDTAAAAQKITKFNPDKTWKAVQEPGKK